MVLEVEMTQTVQAPVGIYNDSDLSLVLKSLLSKIDAPIKRSAPAPKTILIDLFGLSKTGKNKTTEQLDRLFRRNGFNVFCSPETAEWYDIRHKGTDDPLVFQAKHLSGVFEEAVNFAYDRNYHVIVINRGPIDMLYWYEKALRGGNSTEHHRDAVREVIYEFLRKNLVDAFVFFTCSTPVAMVREYGESLTQERGSNMNEETHEESRRIYRDVLNHLDANVPGLPIHRVDTSELDVKRMVQAVVGLILPTLCERFGVPKSSFIPKSLDLMRRESASTRAREERLKLRGHKAVDSIVEAGWNMNCDSFEQEDIYLNPDPGQTEIDGLFSEVIRIRKESFASEPTVTYFTYKGRAGDRVFSERSGVTFTIPSKEEMEEILAIYPQIAVVRKERKRYILSHTISDCTFELNLDCIEGVGCFTEICAVGVERGTRTRELFALASQLGFGLEDVVEGSALGLTLNAGKR